MKKIAISGTIGSGKTKCSEILRDLGYDVFDCDQVVKQLSQKNEKTYIKIIKRFPEVEFHEGINRALLAKIVFNDEVAKKDLEHIIYPDLLMKMKEAMETSEANVFFAEVPLLYESGWQCYFDGVLLISIDDKQRIKRMKQRNMTEEEVLNRMKSQYSDQDKRAKATWVIENNNSVEEFKEKIIHWLACVEDK